VRTSTGTIQSVDPHRPGDVVTEFRPAGPAAVDRQVETARAAAASWGKETALVRGKALDRVAADLARHSEDLAELVVREVGKPIAEARGEVARAIDIFRYFAQMVLAPEGNTFPASTRGAWLLTRRYPVGVVALITPWNFPLAIPAWKLAPALGYGNAVILKPAPAATAVGDLVHEIATESLPPGVFQLVRGDDETGELLVEHSGVGGVSFTGSIEVGRVIAERCARRGVPSQCEMGGQNASVVLRDAPFERASQMIAYAAMGYAGQKCTATSRVIVEEAIYGEFRDHLVGAVEALKVEDPWDESCTIGPLISAPARETALDAIASSTGRVVTGARAVGHEGYYLAPTLVEVEDARDVLVTDEVFAPVAALMRAASAEEAVRRANEGRHGLVAAIYTGDLDRALTLADQIEAGLVRVNAPTSGVDYHVPFGGAKASSIGPREQGLAAQAFYTQDRTILIAP
jgi:alpha-ketoglutaric semialdehyde dehydrogenase